MKTLNLVRRLVAIVLSATMIFGSALAVSAAELEEPVVGVEASNDGSTVQLDLSNIEANGYGIDISESKGVGRFLTGGSGSFYLQGSINAYLGSGNAFADIKVGSNGSDDNGSISCIVRFPTGTAYNLGSILASGGASTAREFGYCPAGTYTFYYYASKNVEHSVWANIYD